MSLWDNVNVAIKRTAKDVAAIVNRVLFLENVVVHQALDINTEYSDKDAASGRFKNTTHKRLDGTVIRTTVLSVDPDLPADVPPLMNLKTVTVFAKDGITILDEAKYKLVYDGSGDVVSETVSV